MLKTLTIAILVGLTSGRPSAPSGEEINIMESKDLIYVYEELSNTHDPTVTQLEEIPNLQPQLQSLLRSKRDVEQTVMDYIERFTTAVTNTILLPIEALVSLLVNAVQGLLEIIFGLVAGILNPILLLLTAILNPILKPLRPLLSPILDPVSKLLASLLDALHLPLDLSGLLTGNTSSLIYVPAAIATTSGSSNSSEDETKVAPLSPAAPVPPVKVSGDSISPAVNNSAAASMSSVPALMTGPAATSLALAQSRRRRASSLNPLSTELNTSRNRRQSLDPSFSSAIISLVSAPLELVGNILSAVGNVILFPVKLILTPIFSLLHIPISIISIPFDIIGSVLSGITSVIEGIVSRIAEPVASLVVGVLDLVLAILNGVGQLVSGLLSIPDNLANTAQQALNSSSSRRRRDVGISWSGGATMPAGPLNVFLSLLSGPLEILSNLLASLLGNFNISYATLQEAVRVLCSNAVKRFLVMAYNQMKNVILPGLDNLLQSIVGSEYIPDYLNNFIAQFHTFYRLSRMMGYLRPS